ncbi:MAG: glycosyltransferase [Candidatus Altiarchaeota archaeon]
MKKKDYSIVIPAYNEERRIEGTLWKYSNYFSDSEIIVILNGCVDGTEEIVSKIAKKQKQISYVVFPEGLGKGGAILEGFKIAKRKYIGFTDADLAVEPEDLESLFELLTEKNQAVIGSRRLPDSKVPVKQPLARIVSSLAFNLFVRTVFYLNIRDTQCPAKVFSRKAIEDILSEIRTKGFEFDVELLWRLRKKGHSILEAPVTWRHTKFSTFRLFFAHKMAISLLKIRFGIN